MRFTLALLSAAVLGVSCATASSVAVDVLSVAPAALPNCTKSCVDETTGTCIPVGFMCPTENGFRSICTKRKAFGLARYFCKTTSCATFHTRPKKRKVSRGVWEMRNKPTKKSSCFDRKTGQCVPLGMKCSGADKKCQADPDVKVNATVACR
jgi:hypothetical protein